MRVVRMCLVFIWASATGILAQYWQEDRDFTPVLESADTPLGIYVVGTTGGKIVTTSTYAVNGVRRDHLARLNADGSLDPTFAAPESDFLAPLALYPDGRILAQRAVGGAASMVRLLADGSIDPAFALALPSTMTTSQGVRAQVLADGRILVWGSFDELGGRTEPGLAVLNADGTVSTSFHSPVAAGNRPSITPFMMADGRIMIAGGFFELGPDKLNYLVRLNPDGSVDSTFKADPALFSQSNPGNVFEQSDGKLLVAIYQSLIRLNPDGTRDTTFTAQPVGSASRFGPQQGDGRLFYVTQPTGSAGSELRRLNADGTPDPSFVITAISQPVIAGDGTYYLSEPLTAERATSRAMVSHVFADGTLDAAFAPRFSTMAAVEAWLRQPDGKVLVAGSFARINGEPAPDAHDLVRLSANGSWDHSFSATIADSERVRVLRMQPTGKILARGNFGDPGLESYVRFNADGTRDASFHLTSGVWSDVAFDGQGRIYANVNVAVLPTTRVAVKRYTVDGDLDSTFTPVPVNGSFAVWSDGKLAVVTASQNWGGTYDYFIHRHLADGSPDSSFPTYQVRRTDSAGTLIALPDGRLMTIGVDERSSRLVAAYRRFTTAGAIDFEYYGQQRSPTGPLITTSQALEAAGVMLDLLRDSNGGDGSRLRVELAAGSSLTAVDVGADGSMMTGLIRYTRSDAARPSFDAAPKLPAANDPGFAFGPLALGGKATLSASGAGLFPLSYQWFKEDAPIDGATLSTYTIDAATAESAGNYSVRIQNEFGSAMSAPLAVAVDATPTAPAISGMLPQQFLLSSGGAASVSATGNPLPSFQWMRDGSVLSAPAVTTTRSRTSVAQAIALAVDPANAGIYTARIANGSGSVTSNPMIAGLWLAERITGAGREIGPNIVHPNGLSYDQFLLEGTAVSVNADADQVTRISFIDLNDDIVQVEFSGAGTLTLVMAGAPDPAATPAKYNQPDVKYVKGHVGIVIAGARETTNVSVFTVGRATAFDPTGTYDILKSPSASNDPAKNGSPLFEGRANTTYDGVADLAYIAIIGDNSEFGGVRCANVSFFASKGITGLYAPNVRFTGPVYVGDISAFDDASPMLVLGSASGDTQVNGGDLSQANGKPLQVAGLTKLQFVPGSNSHGVALPAQHNQARLEQNGVDMTSQIVVDP